MLMIALSLYSGLSFSSSSAGSSSSSDAFYRNPIALAEPAAQVDQLALGAAKRKLVPAWQC